jgi:hypothetical protein
MDILEPVESEKFVIVDIAEARDWGDLTFCDIFLVYDGVSVIC